MDRLRTGGRSPRVDCLAFHWSGDGLAGQLTGRLGKLYLALHFSGR